MQTDDLAVLGCLRALSQHCQSTGNARIPWGGTKREDWENQGHEATFHFSCAQYRDDFLQEARRLLSPAFWRQTKTSDNDPATPQGH